VTALQAPPVVEPAWLTEVRLRAERRVLWCRELWERLRYDGERSLAISHSDVDAALDATLRRAEDEFVATDERTRRLTAELAGLDPDPRFVHLCADLGVEPAEQELLALALAVELVPSLRGVYGYLQDETVPLEPTPKLAAELWGRSMPARPATGSALVRWALARPTESGLDIRSSSTGWVVDPLLLGHLLGDGRPLPVVDVPAGPALYERELEDVVGFLTHVRSPVQVELVAPRGSGRTTLAARAAARLGAPLVAVDAAAIAAAPDPAAAAAREARTARLAGALVAWRDAHALPPSVLRDIGRLVSVTFLVTEEPLPVGEPIAVRRSYTLPPIGRAERLRLWAAGQGEEPPSPVLEWALRPAEIATVARVAPAGEDAARAVCRRLLLDVPPDLLSPLDRPYTWDDLVVSSHVADHLHELEAQARRRGEVLDDWGLARLTPLGRGVTALFSGPTGTGKTMAAQVLARALELELYRVDLAGVVNKYIGETEKHLRAVFAACERAPVLLFFDEADALFGRRMQVNDAHDRFANIEVDYLLQRMEQFDGVAVLATNRKGDLDPAFMRRLRFTIDFAPPTVEERERLWRLSLDGATSVDGRLLAGDVDWAMLARELELTGAGIKSAALAAAFLARSEGSAIETRHLLAAARRELEKQGLVVRTRLEAIA
jgi:ATPase family protein associated with various cellular activities (AAA)/winged helix domain-containing protein